jgi:hypothetical protein
MKITTSIPCAKAALSFVGSAIFLSCACAEDWPQYLDPSGCKQLASAELFREPAAGEEDDMAAQVGGRNQNWAPMTLADGKLLIRDQNQMKCVKVVR